MDSDAVGTSPRSMPAGDEPPLEHILARDARATFGRRDFRRAAVDAGTATEVVLNRIYVEMMSTNRRSTLGQDRRNLASLKEALRDLGVSFDDSLDTLINARNDAAHQGNEPSEDDLRACLDFMEWIIAEHGKPYS